MNAVLVAEPLYCRRAVLNFISSGARSGCLLNIDIVGLAFRTFLRLAIRAIERGG